MAVWHVYILECGDGSLYTGITNDLPARLAAHEKGLGAKYTRGRAPFLLRRHETCPDRSTATRREGEIKRLSRQQKLDLLQQK